jgi:hypothetical protein
MQKQPDGSFVLSMPGSGDALHPIIDIPADIGIFVHSLAYLPPGQKLMGCRAMISNNDYMALWSKVNNVTGRFQEISVDDCDKAIPGGFGKELGEMFAYSAEFGYYGGMKDVVLPDDVRHIPAFTAPSSLITRLKLGIKGLDSLEEYIKREDWTSILES